MALWKSIWLGLNASLLGVSQAPAVECYLKLQRGGENVETDATHSWAEVLGFSKGAYNESVIVSGSQPATVTGKATPATLHMVNDGSIGVMMDALAKGSQCDLRLHVVKPGGAQPTVLIELDFNELYFTAVTADTQSGSDRPIFDVSFVYSSLSYTQTYFDTSGEIFATKVSHDYLNNEFGGIQQTSAPTTGDYAEGGELSDTDSDGMADSWEDFYGLNKLNAADADEDKDGDGFTNKQEYLAGTNPNEITSFFRVNIDSVSGVVSLSWNAVEGRTYTLLESSTPGTGYTQVHQVTPITDGIRMFTPAAGLGKFYKLQVTE